MFWIGLTIGLVLGANISLFLYAIILTGKQADERLEKIIETEDRSNASSQFIIKQ